MGYPWLKTACQSSMLSKNGSLVNFTILHSNYLVAERHKVNGVSIVFTAGPVLHICAWTLLYMVHWGARVMCCAWLELDEPPAYQYTSSADFIYVANAVYAYALLF